MEEEILGFPQIKTLKIPDSGKLRYTSQSLSTPTIQEEEEDPEKKYGFLGAISQGFASGKARADAIDETLKIFQGARDDVSIDEFIKAVQNYSSKSNIDEFEKWSNTYDKYRKSGENILKSAILSIKDEGINGFTGVMVQSLAGLLNEEVIAIGGTAGLAGAGTGAAVSMGAGALPGGAAGFFVGANAIAETMATFTGQIQEELQERGLEFNSENLETLLQDEEVIRKIRMKSAGRGLAIGGVEGLFTLLGVKGATGVAKAVKGVGGKALAGTTAAATEIAGGATGEAIGLTIEGKPLEEKEILVEGLAGIGGAPVDVAVGGLYFVNGQKVTKEVAKIYNDSKTPDETVNIEVQGDDKFKAEVEQKDQELRIEKDIDPELTDKLDRAAVKALEIQRERVLNSNTRSGQNRLKDINEQIDAITDKVTERNKKISDTNQELISVIKSDDSTPAQIQIAKNKLVENNQGLINEIVNKNFDPTKDTTLTRDDLNAEVNLAFANLINSYKPESNVPFGAYVRQTLPKRLPAMFDKLVETKITDEGKKEIIAKQDVTEIQIEDTIEQAEIGQPTITKLKNELNLNDATVNKVVSAVKKVFGTSLPEVTDKSFKKELTTSFKNELTDLVKKNGIFGKDSAEFVEFFTNNAEAIYNSLPLAEMTKTFKPFVEKVINPETGKQAREATEVGKGVSRKLPFNEVKNDFINYFTDPNLNSSTRSDRKTSIAKQIADQLARDEVVDVLLDPEVSQKFKDIQEIEGKAVPEDYLDRIVRSIDRGLEYINKLQKNSNLYVSTGIDKIILQASKIFLQILKAGIKAGKEFVNVLNDALEKMGNALSKKYDENIVEAIKARVETEVLENVASKSMPSFYNIAEIINNVAAGERGRAYEQKLLDVLNSFKIKELTVAKKTANAVGSTDPDIPIKFKNQESNIEVKLSSEEQMGSLTVNYDIDNKNFEITKKVNPEVNNIINQLFKNKQKDTDNYFKRAVELGGVTSKTGVKLTKEQRKKLQDEGLSAKLSGKISTNSAQLLADLENKEGTYYIQMGEKGLFYLGKDILNLGVPKLEGNISLEYRIVSGGAADKQGRKNHSLRMFLRLKDFKTKSTESLDDINSVKRLFSGESNPISSDFNKILEETKGVKADEVFSEAQGRSMGRRANKFKVFVPYSAEDFLGLLYRFAGKGKQGDQHLKWIKNNITRPLTESYTRFENSQQKSNEYLKEAQQIIKDSKINLSEEVFKGYTNDQILRIFMWAKRGYDLESLIGMRPEQVAEIVEYARKNFNTIEIVDSIEKAYFNNDNQYPQPNKEWITGTLTTDLLEFTNTISRKEAFEPFFNNINQIFGNFDTRTGKLSGDNLNKVKAIYGDKFVKALESSLFRIGTGRNKSYQLDQQGNSILNWLNNSIGTIMFFNTRSALLQTISNVNFTNWTDNNPFMLAKAWKNQGQFWKDFTFLFNSDYLKSRRSGLKTDVQEQEIAAAAAQSADKVKAVVATILKKGFLPTQYADSFAISLGGASFYRNRINSYKKNGLSQQEAETEAFKDFREISEETQQSSRPDKISMEQAGFAGRLILAFQNTPMQYNRLAKKAGLDLINGRGDIKTNISKIIYYLGVQNAIFYAAQQALFSIYFGDEEEEREKERYYNVANGMADSILRGSGVYGALISTLKNATIETIEQTREKNPQFINTIKELSGISPPLNSKFRKLLSIDRRFRYKQELEKMRTMGVDTKNPAALSAADALSVAFNLPADRVFRKINNLRTALEEETELWQSIALAMGYSTYDVGINEFKSSSTKPKTTGLKTRKLKTKNLKGKKLKTN